MLFVVDSPVTGKIFFIEGLSGCKRLGHGRYLLLAASFARDGTCSNTSSVGSGRHVGPSWTPPSGNHKRC